MLISVCSRSIIVCQFPIKLLQPFAEFYMAGEYCVVLVDAGHRGHVINFINGRARGGIWLENTVLFWSMLGIEGM